MSAKDAQTLYDAFRSTSYERKVDAVAALKRFIKRNDVSVSSRVCMLYAHAQLDAFPALIDALRTGLSAGSPVLSVECLTCLGHLVKRVALQDAARLRTAAATLVPLLVERLGDPRDKAREAAHSALTHVWRAAPADVERGIRDQGFGSRSWHVREQAVQWVERVQAGTAQRGFVGGMVRLLEDANESVREAAKRAVVEVFR